MSEPQLNDECKARESFNDAVEFDSWESGGNVFGFIYLDGEEIAQFAVGDAGEVSCFDLSFEKFPWLWRDRWALIRRLIRSMKRK